MAFRFSPSELPDLPDGFHWEEFRMIVDSDGRMVASFFGLRSYDYGRKYRKGRRGYIQFATNETLEKAIEAIFDHIGIQSLSEE